MITEPATAPPKPSYSNILSDAHDKITLIGTPFECDNIESGRKTIKQLRLLAYYLVRRLMECDIEELKSLAKNETLGGELYILRTALQACDDEEGQQIMESASSIYRQGLTDHPLYAVSFLMTKVLYTAYRIPNDTPWDKIPKELLKAHIFYQLEGAPFVNEGDEIAYCQNLENTYQKIYDFITNMDNTEQQRVLVMSCFLSCGTRLYFEQTEYNAKRLKTLRHKLLSVAIEMLYPGKLDWTPPPRNPNEKIKLGIVVRTIMTGTETNSMLVNISKLDREKYHIILLCFDLSNGYFHDIAYYRELVNSVDEITYVMTGGVMDCVKNIRKKNIDLLWMQTALGLGDPTPMGQIMAYRLARVECMTGAFYSMTSGNQYFKYFLNIKQIFPVKTWEGEFLEKELNMETIGIYIPGNFNAKDPPNQINTRESLGIPEDAVVYFSGASCNRLAAPCLESWLQILKAVPNSYLVLCPFNPIASPDMAAFIAFHAMLQNAFDHHGDFSDRIRIIKHVNGQAIALMHSWSDIHLSTYPFGGVTTITDSLRGGLAPVTTAGIYTRSNGDACILETYRLLDLVQRTRADYINYAIKLGTDTEYRKEVRARVRKAYAARFPYLKNEVALAFAHVIDQIVDTEFGHSANNADSGNSETGAERPEISVLSA